MRTGRAPGPVNLVDDPAFAAEVARCSALMHKILLAIEGETLERSINALANATSRLAVVARVRRRAFLFNLGNAFDAHRRNLTDRADRSTS